MPLTSMTTELYQLANEKLGGLCSSNEVIRYFLETRTERE